MYKPRTVPTALRVVAVLFLISGIGSVIDVVAALFLERLYINIGVLGIPAYYGLLRFSPGWRTFALVCIWLGLVLCPVLFITGLITSIPADLSVFGVNYAKIPAIYMSIVSAPVFLLEIWQYGSPYPP